MQNDIKPYYLSNMRKMIHFRSYACMQFACRGEEGVGMGATYSLMNRNLFFFFNYFRQCFEMQKKIFVIVYHDGFDGR